MAATLAGLLSWDFERLPDAKKPLLVIFADSVEYVQGGNRQQEKLLNRIVHLTPGFLWVFTSRNSLRGEEAFDVDVRKVSDEVLSWFVLGAEAQARPRLRSGRG